GSGSDPGSLRPPVVNWNAADRAVALKRRGGGRAALMPSIRYHVTPRDAPPAVAARKLGLTLEQFSEMLPLLLVRGFPPIDKTADRFDLKGIDRWQDARYPQLFGHDQVQVTGSPSMDPSSTRERMKALAKCASPPT